jgi:EAL and modified HD-GYP domain-containing signal transduction protein
MADPLDHPLLDQVTLGYGSFFNARRQAAQARLTVHGLASARARPPTVLADELCELLQHWWPAGLGVLNLNLTDESWLQALLARPELPAHWQWEVPAFWLASPELQDLVSAAAARGVPLVLKGRLAGPLPTTLATAFVQVMVDADEAGSGAPLPGCPWVLTGATGLDQVHLAFQQGAFAVHGWPQQELPQGVAPPRKELPASVRVVMDLLRRVDLEESGERMEATLRSDPALAFRLMRLINSPAFGLSVEITSFAHALMLLGYQRLKRWLALLLAHVVDAPDLRPLMTLAVRRALLMEAMTRAQGDEAGSGEAFICGVFSLLDQMLGQTFEQLLASLPVSAGVAQTLGSEHGPHSATLTLARAVEAELPHDIQEAGDLLLCSPAEVNRAILHTLNASRQLQAD